MRLSLPILALLTALSADAASVSLSFVPSRSGEATVELRQLSRVADYTKPAALTRKVKLDAPVSIDLPEGHWALDVVSQTVWHATQTLSVFSAPVALAVPLRDVATVTGHLAPAEKAELPKEVRLAFDDKNASITCPVSDGAFHC